MLTALATERDGLEASYRRSGLTVSQAWHFWAQTQAIQTLRSTRNPMDKPAVALFLIR